MRRRGSPREAHASSQCFRELTGDIRAHELGIRTDGSRPDKHHRELVLFALRIAQDERESCIISRDIELSKFDLLRDQKLFDSIELAHISIFLEIYDDRHLELRCGGGLTGATQLDELRAR